MQRRAHGEFIAYVIYRILLLLLYTFKQIYTRATPACMPPYPLQWSNCRWRSGGGVYAKKNTNCLVYKSYKKDEKKKGKGTNKTLI